ncbi:MAG: carbonic anhydrase [Schwartzia sp.]|nr:carbonic anhydrase [Schwartzia sp. (in: firmicutes)]
MTAKATITAKEALAKLKAGNENYLGAKTSAGDISPAIREKTAKEGQFPYAIVVTCSDSRVVPESIFSAGIGELFVIRVAGFVIDKHQLGSIEYAAGHLGTPLVVVLGHTNCGAVGAALASGGHTEGYVGSIVAEIQKAIGAEKDPDKAVELNVKHSKAAVEDALGKALPITVVGAVYHIDSGKVEFLG